MDKNKKHGNKNALLFVAILVLFLVIVGVVFYGVFMSVNMKKSAMSDDSKLEVVVESTENTNSNGDPIVEYDKTSDWNQDVIYVASLLNTSMVNADDVMHQVSALCETKFSSKLYFFNRFEKVDGTDNEYRIMSGDSMYALRVQIDISDDSVTVTYIDEVDVVEWKNETTKTKE